MYNFNKRRVQFGTIPTVYTSLLCRRQSSPLVSGEIPRTATNIYFNFQNRVPYCIFNPFPRHNIPRLSNMSNCFGAGIAMKSLFAPFHSIHNCVPVIFLDTGPGSIPTALRLGFDPMQQFLKTAGVTSLKKMLVLIYSINYEVVAILRKLVNISNQLSSCYNH
jgi:hypothetical protein